MKHTFIKYLAAASLILGFASCEKNNLVIDQEPLAVPEAARFLNSASTGTFYVQETPAPGTMFKLPVGVTTVSNTERKVKFTYSGTAVAGTHYTAPAEVTIPAGSTIDTLRIQGLFDNLVTGEARTLKVKITNDGGFVNHNAYKDSFVVTIRKYCNVILPELSGDFDNTHETNSSGGSPFGPYSSYVDLTSLTATTATAVFGNFWGYPIEVTGTINWTDPANFSVVIPLQATGLDYDPGQPISVRTSPGQISTFSSCDQTYALTVDFIVNNYPTTGQSAYYAQNYKIYIER